MSLRKFMHKRNKYKEEPNFKQLAILYPGFRKIAVTDIAGKVKINFKDVESLKILTKTLLKHDFNLDVDIPPNHLVPALPLRLNYILWIEDLLNHCGIQDLSTVHGLDIGTGAICIYPILFSNLYKTKMTCTDIDPKSIISATENIEKNNLQDLIEVILIKKESILKEALEKNEKYSFVMCNPPFFETDKGLGKKSKQEPPRNAPTGNANELEVKGGEREFILRLIEESLEYKHKIKIYTTMFGQKSSLAFLRNELTKKRIFNATWTEFCQGFTKRWGIAWTFEPKSELDLTTAPVIRTRAEVSKMKKDKSMEIVFPARKNLSCLNEVVTALKIWITELKIKIKEIQLADDDYPCWACQLIGYNDTWSHARRKRRMAMRQEALKKRRVDKSESSNEIDKLQNDESESTESEIKSVESNEPLLVCTLLVGEKSEHVDDSGDNDEDDSEEDTNNEKMLRICMLFESGTGGKLSLETLRQYLVNKLNIRDFFHKKNPSKPNKKKRKRKKIKKDQSLVVCQNKEL
ncbi:U6 small nuclear RNA (adenine-(43)-N(6))-methyltransferase [Nasonia vitripennis]|uniref:U6 small nuclear RNA (adenine-(43)-N(6))-methyltransferase n=1 Tax=Nasonia vitripennis TaxID=7425 RepID=A0A7M7PXF3_NASVI|nr:U6 small nuclear RNA (adenine-(43)-N(6))-methyltransferase [Nasonia vitripennis]